MLSAIGSPRIETKRELGWAQEDNRSTWVEKGSILGGLDGTALGGFLRQERGRGSRFEHAETGNLLKNGPIL